MSIKQSPLLCVVWLVCILSVKAQAYDGYQVDNFISDYYNVDYAMEEFSGWDYTIETAPSVSPPPTTVTTPPTSSQQPGPGTGLDLKDMIYFVVIAAVLIVVCVVLCVLLRRTKGKKTEQDDIEVGQRTAHSNIYNISIERIQFSQDKSTRTELSQDQSTVL